jgi:PAS domain-containing protein
MGLSISMIFRLPKEVRFFFLLFFLTIAIWGVEEAVTRWLGDQTLAPLLSVISLGLIAARFSQPFVLTATILLCLLSYWLIQDASKYPLIRSLTVLIGGVIASWASAQKARLGRQAQEFEVVLMNLPLPWILCDSNNKTLRISPAFASLAGKTLEELVGAPRFSLLASLDPHSTGISSSIARSELLQIHPFLPNRSTTIFRAIYVPVLIQNNHCLLTILKET